MVRLRTFPVLLVLGLLITGCGDDAVPSAAAPTAPTAPAATPTAPSSAAPSTAPTRPTAATPDPVVELRGDGLVADDELLFRIATKAQVTSDVQAALGPSTGSYAVDCGAEGGTATEHDGLVLLFAGEEFVGWAERGSPERDLPTAEGLRLQSSVADVRAALPGARITGRTFTSPAGLSGRFDGDGRVVELRGGARCDPR